MSRYVPAAGRAGLTRLYDPVMRVTMREARWRGRLRDQVLAGLGAGGTVLDIGAGTGSFATALAQERPDAEVIALDGDPQAIALGRAKPGAERVRWLLGSADALALDDAWADRVVMSLVLHHLDDDAKAAALLEAHRVLRRGGSLHVADWGRPAGPVPRAGFALLRALDGRANTRAHARGELAGRIADAGFSDVRTRARLATVWGTLELLTAVSAAA